jgi:plastocyanin
VRRRAVLLALVASLAAGHAGIARADGQVLTFTSAPVTVDPYGVKQSTMLIPSPAVDGFVTGIEADAVDQNGVSEPISHVMLHHIVFAKLGYPDPTCSHVDGYDGRPAPFSAQRFYAEGEERTAIAMPAGYGYPNRGTDHWAMVFMLMNHRNVAETVSVQYRIQYVTDQQLIPVKPYWLDVHNCSADPIFNVPGTGGLFSTYARSADFTMPEGGTFVAGGAHLHGGGLRLDLTDRSCGGAPLFTSEPTWGLPLIQPVMHEPGPLHMTTFTAVDGIPVSAGDRLRLTAVYDDSIPHVRVMGIMLLYLVPGTVSPCAPVPALPADALSHPGLPPRIVLPLLRAPTGPARPTFRTFVSDFRFGAERVTLARGSTFRWDFAGPSRHDVTLASGPVGFASPSVSSGSFAYRFTRPGVYRLFCSLHPTEMTQIVTVR